MYPQRQPSRNTLTAPIRKMRFAWVAMFFAGWVVLIGGRLVWLQVIQHSEWMLKAERQQQRTFDVAPRRGVLYDRNLRELAMTVLVDSVYAVPSELGDNRAQAAQMLARVVHTDPQDGFTSGDRILARFNDSRNFAWVARRVDAATSARVRELNLKGVYIQKEFKRFYPDGDLAAQVLGYVGTDDNGLSGLEEQFDDEMHGEPGHMLTAVDAKRHVLGSVESEPMPGENLVLSIDSNIQYMAERALDAQVAKMKALHGTVVVQDPHTGQILALAVSPRFNPNDARHIQPGSLQDLAVSDVYEPGSTFKLVTYATALDAAGVQPTDMVDCQGGAMTMFGRTLHDDHTDRFGVVTVQYALEHSSDVGAAKMALKVGANTFYKYIRAFGFGQRSGIELPSETRGLLRPPKSWGATSILSLAIGQEVGVTPVQLVTMVSTIANGGVYMPPHVLLASADDGNGHLKPAAFHPENELPATLPDGAHRVITELTAAKMRSMMEGIVTEGTGRNAALNGYSAGGKTGTAQKVDPVTHTYSHTNLVASFAGFAPVSSPVVSIAVVIDNPTVGTRYGAETSAPVFREIAQQVLEYLGVPHDQPLKTQKELAAAPKLKSDEDGPSENIADLNAMFDEINHLPADDPLRQAAKQGAISPPANASASVAEASTAASRPSRVDATKPSRIIAMLPKKVLAAFSAENDSGANGNDSAALQAPKVVPAVDTRSNGSVVVDAGKRIAVPSFSGSALRDVVEKAASLDLRVQPLGSGLARDQAPAAGTMVPAGTEVVVRFAR
ncbi:MAG TPA: penicillin-binding protein [Acidobacteriaceae bacterium]|nr:penicillin-binding protein [Acidobacteriaceae bacterium]